MENKNKNKKIAIYIAILIVLLGGSFIIYKIASASIDNAIISYAEMTSIETGEHIDPEGEDLLSTTCTNGLNCTSTYTPGKDSSNNNILVKSFDKIKYTFGIKVKDSTDEYGDVDDVRVNLKVSLSDEDKKYVSFEDASCNEPNGCAINNVSSFDDVHYYTLVLNVNNAPNGYQIKPSFTFDVEENPNDTEIKLGYNTQSSTGYYYTYDNETYTETGPNGNYMPTIVSSVSTSSVTYMAESSESYTQAATYDGKYGRFITYYFGIKLNNLDVAGTYLETNEITFRVSFTQDGAGTPIVNENWIRLYGPDAIDGIRPFESGLPYSVNTGEKSKNIEKPGNITVTKDGNDYIVKLSNYELLLNAPTLCANNSPSYGVYIATFALTNFSPRMDSDGQNAINNTLTITRDNQNVATLTVQNVYETLATTPESTSQNYGDVSAKSGWYNEGEETPISTNGTGAVSKGTILNYKTTFKNNITTLSSGIKEVIKFDTDAYRVIPYSNTDDIDIIVKCGKSECSGISKDDFEVKFVTGSFDNTNYDLNDISSLRLSDSDKQIANACSSINLSGLNKDQIQNLYGGPCIKAKANVENVYNKIEDSSKIEGDSEVEIPISKVVVQTKDGVTIPDEAEVIVTVKVRVRNVSDLTRTYQATSIISTSDFDQKLHYFAPQINTAISPDSYVKTNYAGQTVPATGSMGDTLKIVNFTLRQNVTVTNKDSDGTIITKYRTSENETITYKVETSLIDNNINVGADDTWYIREVRVLVRIPKELIYIPDDDLIAPINVTQEDGRGTTLEYLLITSSDTIKSNMKIKDIYFKTKLNPTLSGRGVNIVVTTNPYAININEEIDTSIGKGGSFAIKGTGVQEVIGNQTIGESGSLIEKNGTINYVLNAYNNVGSIVDNYTILDILPYNGDENGSNFKGSYKVKVTSDEVGLNNIKCTKEIPSRISLNNEEIWEDCSNITSDFVDDITAIRIDNITILKNSNMGNIVISLKTKDNEPSNKYNNRFKGYTESSVPTESNMIEASVINRTISGYAFVDNTGNSIKDGSESYVSGIPVSLYKVSNDELEKIADTETNENGYYEFGNLSKGRYKIRAKYDINKYDLALRYATEDTNRDSDAYLIDENGTVEISDKSETSRGLVLNPPVNNITNMDIGLLLKQTFGFSMRKYITKIELNNNGSLTTNNYDNLSTVSLSVLNPNKFTAKVYYGISITNNSNKAGYINLVKEDIPSGFIFDKNYPENAGWFEMDGQLGNRTLEDTVVNPSETVYLQIVLFLPARDEAGTFINTAAVAEISEYNPVIRDIKDEEYVNSDHYSVGDKVRFAGADFHVIGAIPNGSEQILTLLADTDSSISKRNHGSGVYRWSESNINNYINTDWVMGHNINTSALIPFYICDDASGLFNTSSNGGIVDAPTCASGIYTTSYVRLLNASEYTRLRNNLQNQSFLTDANFWLMDSVYPTVADNDSIYGNDGSIRAEYNTSGKAKYVDASSGTAKAGDIATTMNVRPVIRISTHNIILE